MPVLNTTFLGFGAYPQAHQVPGPNVLKILENNLDVVELGGVPPGPPAP